MRVETFAVTTTSKPILYGLGGRAWKLLRTATIASFHTGFMNLAGCALRGGTGGWTGSRSNTSPSREAVAEWQASSDALRSAMDELFAMLDEAGMGTQTLPR